MVSGGKEKARYVFFLISFDGSAADSKDTDGEKYMPIFSSG